MLAQVIWVIHDHINYVLSSAYDSRHVEVLYVEIPTNQQILLRFLCPKNFFSELTFI
jgi:hypothetical protein